jgi:DNA-binding CsgD family transcriptional regulator
LSEAYSAFRLLSSQWIKSSLGAVHAYQHRYDLAEQFLLRALAIREQILGAEDVTVGQTIHNLAELYRRQGRTSEAEAAYQRALPIREKQEGPDHPNVAETLRGLAGIYAAQNRNEEAHALYQRALIIYERALGAEHPEIVKTREDYTALLKKTEHAKMPLRPEQSLAGQSEIQLPANSTAVLLTFQHTLHNGVQNVTQREITVLRLLAQGLTSPQIAQHLMITLHTVNTHIRPIYSKLGIFTRSAATRYAIECGLIVSRVDLQRHRPRPGAPCPAGADGSFHAGQ